MKLGKKGVSELFGAVLLILITAVLGIIIVQFFINTTNQIKSTMAKLGEKCIFRIVDVAINKSNGYVSSIIIKLYGVDYKTCKIKYVYVLNSQNLSTIDFIELRNPIKLSKGELKSITLISGINLTSGIELPFVLRIYSTDGSFDEYYVG